MEWDNLTTLLQLGAGLNFAYASLELFVDQPLRRLQGRMEELINALKINKESKSPISAKDFIIATTCMEKIRSVQIVAIGMNPYIAPAAGIYTFCQLVWIAYNPQSNATADEVALCLGLSFGWFAAILLLMMVSRMILDLVVEPRMPKEPGT